MSKSVIVKEYLGNNIGFKVINGEVYANATEMAKVFPNKNLSDWINGKATSEYIEALCSENGRNRDFYIEVIKGGIANNQGTWIHEQLILDLARWLNVSFRIWCDNQIATLLKDGSVNLSIPKTYAEALLEAGRLALENERLAEDNKHKSTLIKGMTEELDGVFLRVIAVDYVNKMKRKTNENHAFIWNNIYTILGRKLKKDLPYQLEKFRKEQIALVNKNKKHNSENKLKGVDKLQPYTLKSARADISMVEYVCDILHEGYVLVQVMSEVFEVGIDEIVKKYNHVAMEDAYKRIEM